MMARTMSSGCRCKPLSRHSGDAHRTLRMDDHSLPGGGARLVICESIAIEARYRRHAERWRPHLEKSKAVIEEAVSKVAPPPRGRARLGPSLIFLSKSSRMRSTLWNSSISYIERARQIAAGFADVELGTTMSGAAAALAALPRNAVTAPLLVAPPSLMPDTDLVVSANLLSQLPDYSEISFLKAVPLAQTARKDLHLVAMIIQLAQRLGRVGLLITDTERQYARTTFPDWVLLRCRPHRYEYDLALGHNDSLSRIPNTPSVCRSLGR